MGRLLSLLAFAAAAMPFAFGIIRAMTTGSDLRYIWVALAAGAGAGAVRALASASAQRSRSAFTISAAIFVISTAAAGLAAWLLGTIFGLGMLVVVSSFGGCFAVATCLDALARRGTA